MIHPIICVSKLENPPLADLLKVSAGGNFVSDALA